MKTIKIKTTSTGKAVAKVAGLLFCTSLFGLTLAAPSVAGGFVLGNPSISSDIHIMWISYPGKWPYTYWAWAPRQLRAWGVQLPTPPPSSDNPYPDAPGGPEPLTTLGSVMGAGGLVLLKKRRSEKDKLA